MHEHILAAVRRGNEAEALGIVEPLDCTCSHGNTPLNVEFAMICRFFLEAK
jgi:hypothetical protein